MTYFKTSNAFLQVDLVISAVFILNVCVKIEKREKIVHFLVELRPPQKVIWIATGPMLFVCSIGIGSAIEYCDFFSLVYVYIL